MPFTFPSHQGLIAPIWRKWPHRFDIPAMFIGSAMPDIIDGLVSLTRGYLGQSIGHSLIALPLLCIPGGLLLLHCLRRYARVIPMAKGNTWIVRSWNDCVDYLRRSSECRPSIGCVIYSLSVGGFSHLFFDLISHGKFTWLYPWWTSKDIFPRWWHAAWVHVVVPGYKNPYPIGVHFLIWVFLSLVGIWILFYPILLKTWKQPMGRLDSKSNGKRARKIFEKKA